MKTFAQQQPSIAPSTAASVETSGIDFEMFAYPTGNPTWVGSVVNKATNKQLFEMSFQRPFHASFSGDIYKELTREDTWDHCKITPNECTPDELRGVLQEIEQRSYIEAHNLIAQCDLFYPNLKCREAATSLMESQSSFLALVMLMSEIPAKTPWSTRKSMGYDDGTGFGWHAPSFSMEWNMRVGYPIMVEALKRKVEEMLA